MSSYKATYGRLRTTNQKNDCVRGILNELRSKGYDFYEPHPATYSEPHPSATITGAQEVADGTHTKCYRLVVLDSIIEKHIQQLLRDS